MSTPSGNARAPPSGMLARRAPLLAATLAVGTAGYFYLAKRPAPPEGTPSAPPRTQGIKNIEKAYTNAGATATHTKAYGGTPMGDKENQELREHSPAGTNAPKGVQKEGYGDDQRPSTSTTVEKKLQKVNYGDEKGK